MSTIVTNLIGVAAFTVALSWLGPIALDGMDDHHAEHATAASLVDAQRAEAAQLRRDMAAARLCREAHGEAGFTWTVDGQLVCVPRRGIKPVTYSATAQAQP